MSRSLEAREYVATEADIRALAKQNLEAAQTRSAVRVTYLRALVATAQHELGHAFHHKGIPEQVATIEAVHARFYDVVLATVCTSDVQDNSRLTDRESHRRALERNRRSNFARSAKSTLLSWLCVEGHDLRKLDATKVTKNTLAVAAIGAKGQKPLRPALVRRQTEAAADKFVRLLTRKLVKADKAAALEVLHDAISKLSKMLLTLGAEPVKKASIAIEENRLWETATGVFMPLPARPKRPPAA